MKKFLSLLLALTMLLTLCCVASAEAGVFTGVGDSEIGGKGAIEVAVTVDENGAVTAIEVTKNGDTAGISDPAVAQIPGLIVEQQTANVDAVAGATKTSDAIMAAVLDAVTKAGLDTVKWSTKVETVAEKAEDVTIETETGSARTVCSSVWAARKVSTSSYSASSTPFSFSSAAASALTRAVLMKSVALSGVT